MHKADLHQTISVKKDQRGGLYFFTNLKSDLIFSNGVSRPEFLTRDVALSDESGTAVEKCSDLLHDYIYNYQTPYQLDSDAVSALAEIGCDVDITNYYRVTSTITDRVHFYHLSGYLV
jgi:hypothetical protein